jgi:glycine hydroxymethyltransferase
MNNYYYCKEKNMSFPFIQDEEIQKLADQEARRQADGLEMIPSENHTSQAVLDVLGSRLTDKYSEGYPGARYYGGCEFVDKVENIARDRAQPTRMCRPIRDHQQI